MIFNRSYNWILLDARHWIAIECALFRFDTMTTVAYDEKGSLCRNNTMVISSIDQITKFLPTICWVVISRNCSNKGPVRSRVYILPSAKNDEFVIVYQIGVSENGIAVGVSCPNFPTPGR